MALNIKVITNNTEQQIQDCRKNIYKINSTECKSINNEIKQMDKIEYKKDINSIKNKFKIDDKVKHIEEGIVGIVKFIGKDKITIAWNDGTRERMPLEDIDDLEYVNDIETVVSPLTPQISNIKEEKSSVDSLIDKALTDLEDNYDDIEDGNPNKEILEKQALERKVDTLTKKLEENKIQNIKEKVMEEIISLMKDKGMIKDEETEKLQRDSILNMDDNAFESFKMAILSTNKSNKKVVKKTEAELALEAIKNGTFNSSPNQGSLIDFSMDSGGEPGSRDLQSIKTAKPNFDDKKLNLDGFRNLQGITKPIQVESMQTTPVQNMKEAIKNMEWTTTTKIF